MLVSVSEDCWRIRWGWHGITDGGIDGSAGGGCAAGPRCTPASGVPAAHCADRTVAAGQHAAGRQDHRPRDREGGGDAQAYRDFLQARHPALETRLHHGPARRQHLHLFHHPYSRAREAVQVDRPHLRSGLVAGGPHRPPAQSAHAGRCAPAAHRHLQRRCSR